VFDFAQRLVRLPRTSGEARRIADSAASARHAEIAEHRFGALR
jgi:hypothetical protein